METSRDDEHEEDVVTRSMFETLCEGEPSLSLSTATARPKRRSGKDDGNDGTGDVLVMTMTTIDYHNTTTRHAQSHNNITFNKKHTPQRPRDGKLFHGVSS
jgi:hypothetical protein